MSDVFCTGAENMPTETVERKLVAARLRAAKARTDLARAQAAIANLTTELERRQAALLDPHAGIGGLFT